jgi:hypothetical protein
LHERDVLYDKLEYFREDDSDLSTGIVNDYERRKLTLMDLIQELDIVNAEQVNADFTKKEKRLRQDILKVMISNKLDIADSVRYFVDSADEFFEQAFNEIDSLKKMQSHRHKTVLGLYTEKPVY